MCLFFVYQCNTWHNTYWKLCWMMLDVDHETISDPHTRPNFSNYFFNLSFIQKYLASISCAKHPRYLSFYPGGDKSSAQLIKIIPFQQVPATENITRMTSSQKRLLLRISPNHGDCSLVTKPTSWYTAQFCILSCSDVFSSNFDVWYLRTG